MNNSEIFKDPPKIAALLRSKQTTLVSIEDIADRVGIPTINKRQSLRYISHKNLQKFIEESGKEIIAGNLTL